MPNQENQSPRLQNTLVVLLLAGAVWAVYGQTAAFDFLGFDDVQYVTGNDVVKGGLSAGAVGWAFTSFAASNWHPLTWLSHLVDVELFGLHAGAHHLVNVAWHTIDAVLLFFTLLRLTRCRGKSALVAALFALHPLHVESVAWVAERKDVLSAFFFFLTLYVYALYAEKPSASRYAATLAAFAAGLLAKPMLVTLPCVLLLLDFWPLGRLRVQEGAGGASARVRVVVEKLPFFALSAASSVVTVLAQQGAISTAEEVSLPLRAVLAVQGYAFYLEKLVWPSRLAVLYPLPRAPSAGAALALGVLLLALTASAVWAGRRRPWLPVGWLWFVGTLVPVIGLVHVGYETHADRYTYLPYVGLFLVLAWGAAELANSLAFPHAVRAAVVGVVLCALGAAAWQQTTYWRDSLTLFGRCVRVTSANYVARSLYGTALVLAGRDDEAGAQFVESARVNPDFFTARVNLGAWMFRRGMVEPSARQFREALRIRPESGDALGALRLCEDVLAGRAPRP